MRMLFTACPMYGHVNTVLSLAVAAQAAGHDVVLATGPDLVPRVEQRGVTAWTVGPTHHAAGGGPTANWVEYFTGSADKRATDLLPRAVRWRPDVVVSEETELAGPVAAAVTGAQHVVHGLSIMPGMPLWEAFSPAIDQLYRTWRAPGTAEAVRQAIYLDICPPSLQLPGERVWPRTQPVRPTLGQPTGEERLPDAVYALPYSDTVHLTLGTVFYDNRGVLQSALEGLRDLPVNLLVTIGPDADPAAFGPQPANILLAPYLPHALVLPECRAVVSQGGGGVMFGALAHGLPQLIMPQGGDQFRNAEACQIAGAGLALLPEQVTAQAVGAAMNRLLNEADFARRAATVQAEIAAMPDAGEVLDALVEDAKV
jgi:UDP:flavonoid glycosyltransferase YjiC (YdhE family)